jgi:hypothetical protein
VVEGVWGKPRDIAHVRKHAFLQALRIRVVVCIADSIVLRHRLNALPTAAELSIMIHYYDA